MFTTRKDFSATSYIESTKTCRSKLNNRHLIPDGGGILHLFGNDYKVILALEVYQKDTGISFIALNATVPAQAMLNDIKVANGSGFALPIDLTDTEIAYLFSNKYVSMVTVPIVDNAQLEYIDDKLKNFNARVSAAEGRQIFIQDVLACKITSENKAIDFGIDEPIKFFIASVRDIDSMPVVEKKSGLCILM